MEVRLALTGQDGALSLDLGQLASRFMQRDLERPSLVQRTLETLGKTVCFGAGLIQRGAHLLQLLPHDLERVAFSLARLFRPLEARPRPEHSGPRSSSPPRGARPPVASCVLAAAAADNRLDESRRQREIVAWVGQTSRSARAPEWRRRRRCGIARADGATSSERPARTRSIVAEVSSANTLRKSIARLSGRKEVCVLSEVP